jgi:hypothetical protein
LFCFVCLFVRQCVYIPETVMFPIPCLAQPTGAPVGCRPVPHCRGGLSASPAPSRRCQCTRCAANTSALNGVAVCSGSAAGHNSPYTVPQGWERYDICGRRRLYKWYCE